MTAPLTQRATAVAASLGRLHRDGFRIGPWEVEPRRNRISADGAERTVDPRSMEVLVLLAARAGEVVTRDELNDAVWAETFVTDNTVSQAVSRLRKALDDRRNEPQFIETISKSGYRLLAEVLPVNGAQGLHGPIAWAVLGLPLMLGLALALSLAFTTKKPPDAAAASRPSISVTPEVMLVGSQFDSVLSPSGDRIAFSWRPDDRSPWRVWLQEIGGDNPVRLAADEMSEMSQRLPAWSPDGSALAYALFSIETGPAGIYSTSVLGGATERLADCPSGLRNLHWSPNGDILVLAINGENGAPSRLEILDLASGLQHLLTPPLDGTIGDRAPVFSPDGLKIAFERRETSSRHHVMVVDVTGKRATALTHNSWGQLRGVDWSADGSHVIYASNSSGQFRLWQVPTGGGDSSRLPVEDVWVTQPSVSRSGGRLIYRAFRDVVDIWSLPLDERGVADGDPVRTVASTRSERNPAWSPDGRRIAFVSDRSGSAEVWTGHREGVEAMRHTDFSGPVPSAPAWSPDGARLVFDAATEGHGDLWTMRTDSRRPDRLTTDSSEDLNGIFSSDGRWIYFASNRSGSWDIWRMPAGGGKASRWTTDGGFLALESPGGRFLYFAKLDEPGIWRMPTQGGPAEAVVEELSLSDWGNWAIGRDGIYCVRRGPTTLQFLDFAGHEVRTVFTPPGQIPFLERSLSLSPDGRSLLFAMIDRSDDEILRVDMLGI